MTFMSRSQILEWCDRNRPDFRVLSILRDGDEIYLEITKVSCQHKTFRTTLFAFMSKHFIDCPHCFRGDRISKPFPSKHLADLRRDFNLDFPDFELIDFIDNSSNRRRIAVINKKSCHHGTFRIAFKTFQRRQSCPFCDRNAKFNSIT